MRDIGDTRPVAEAWRGAARGLSAELPVMELKRGGPEAAALCAALHHASFEGREPWGEAVFASILAMPGVVVWLACVGACPQVDAEDGSGTRESLPAGFIVSRHVVDEGEILSLGVHPRWRRRGIARKLLHHVVQQARSKGDTLFLEVRVSNHAAARLYGQAGFRQVAIRPRYYDDGEDACLLRLSP